MVDKNKAEEKKEKENKVKMRRLFDWEVRRIVAEFAGRRVIADSEFFLVPIKGEVIHTPLWEKIPWSDDKGETIARYIPICERIKQILAKAT